MTVVVGSVGHDANIRCSMQGCSQTCYQKNVINRCGCGDSYYPLSGTAFGGADIHWPACLSTNATQGKSFQLKPQFYLHNISTTNCWNIMTESKVYYRDYSSTITITFVILIIALISAFSPACAETFTSRCATTRCGVPTLADTRTYQRRWIITWASQCIAMQPLSNSSNLWPCLAPLPLKFHDDTSNGSRVTVLTNKQTNKHTQTHTHKRTVLKTIPFVALLSASPVDFIMFFFYCIDILCVCSVILCVWCWQILWFCA